MEKVKILLTICLFFGFNSLTYAGGEDTTVLKNHYAYPLFPTVKHISDTGVQNSDSVPIKEKASEPFAFADFSWLCGTSRKTSAPAFDSKYFTGDITFDFNYTHSYNHPIDNTVVGSTALARDNELQLSFLGVGGDIHYDNVRGRIMMQFGTRSTIVPRNDGSSYKGQYDLQTIYRYISECRHFHVLYRFVFLQ
jgi:hypothetical protein